MPSGRRSKYNAKRTTVDGLKFDSLSEAARYAELRLLEAAGAIANLQVHPRFVVQDAFVDGDGRRWGAIVYVADFAYTEGDQTIVEDVKGTETQAWRLKRKLFLKRYDMPLRVIPAGRKGAKYV